MSQFLAQQAMWVSVLFFCSSAAIIAFFGVRMTYISRDLAAVTRMGQALMGAVFIGAATSLSGIIASATAAWYGNANLAVSNSLGGIAAQTMFLVLGDIIYRKANLEFAAASVENMMMSAQLMLLLGILLGAFMLPDLAGWSIHPFSFLLIAVYIYTVKMLVDTHEKPMWLPRTSKGTIIDTDSESTEKSREDIPQLVGGFLLCAFMVALAGWMIANAGMEIIQRNNMSAGIMGGIFIAISTSLPELIIAITAVRLGALSLAVGDIIGGNAFDTLFVAVSDIFYTEGSVYSAISEQEKVWLAAAMVMNATLLLGLIYRERKGFASIGLESLVILLVYVSTVSYLCF